MAGSQTRKKTTGKGKTTTSGKNVRKAASGRPARGRKAAATGRRTYAGKGTASGRKTPSGRGRRKAPVVEETLMDDIVIVVVLAVSVLLVLSTFNLGGKAGNAAASVVFGIFGGVAYILPYVLFLGTAFAISNKGNHRAVRKIIAAVVFACGVMAVMTLFSATFDGTWKLFDGYIISSASHKGGGVIGSVLCGLIYPSFGKIASAVIFIAIMLISWIVMTGYVIYGRICSALVKGFHQWRENSEKRREERAIQRQEAEEAAIAREEEEARRILESEKCEEEISKRLPASISALSEAAQKRSSTDKKNKRVRTDKNETVEKAEPMRQNESAVMTETGQLAAENSLGAAEAAAGNIEPKPAAAGTQPEPASDIHPVSAADRAAAVQDDHMQDGYMSEPFIEINGEPVGEVKSDENEKAAHEIRESVLSQAVLRDVLDFEEDLDSILDEPVFIGTAGAGDALGTLSGTDIISEEVHTDIDIEEAVDASAENLQDMPSDMSETVSEKSASDDRSALEKNISVHASEVSESDETITPDQTVPEKAYIYPPMEILKKGSYGGNKHAQQGLKATAEKLQRTLDSFGVGARVTNVSCGPSVTRYEVQPEVGVKVNKIVNLADDIKLNLAVADIRIEAPIPGKAAVGIEVPNRENETVMLRDLLESPIFAGSTSGIAFAAGKDIGGQVIVADIAKMPHLLIAGATGSGKSVCINTMIISILYHADPKDVRLIMIDPKVVELSVYNGIPHLLIPVVTDPKKASGALNWAVAEMTDRYNKFAELGVRDVKGYNAKIAGVAYESETYKHMPQIVIIVDELADLMMVASSEVEDAICRLAQLARAAGIHLVIATQRPSVNVITGVIKANIPSRIAFSVSSGVDSRTIIDMNGAEKLLGKGDMLFYPQGYQKPVRVQGAFISDNEVSAVVDYVCANNLEASGRSHETAARITAAVSASASPAVERDVYFAEAGRYIIEKDKASIGMLQRMYKVGFNRAARIMDQLCEAGVVGPEEGTKPRRILMSEEEFEMYIEEYI